MKARSRIILSLMIAILFFCSYVVFFGLTFGHKSFKPLRALSLGTDLEGGATAVFKLDSETDEDGNEVAREASVTQTALNQITEIIYKRLAMEGLTLSTVSKQNENEVRVDINLNDTSMMKDAAQVFEFLSTTADLSIKDVDGNVLIIREDISKVQVSQDSLGKYVVYIFMKDDAKKKLEEATNKVIAMDSSKRYISVVLDGEEVNKTYVSSAVTSGVLGFQSSYTAYQATSFSNLVNSGKLPISVTVSEQQKTGAGFGQGAKHIVFISCMAAAALCVLLLIFFYRVPGFLSSVSVLFYVTLSLFLASLLYIQVTLPATVAFLIGLAYMLLSHVNIYEKSKKEYAGGKNLRAAFKVGYSDAGKEVSNLFFVLFILFMMFVMSNIPVLKTFSYSFGIAVFLAYVITMIFNRLFIRLALNSAPEKVSIYFSAKAGKGGDQ